MRILRFLSICILIFTLSSCAAKQLPKPTGIDQGLLVVPTEGIRKVDGKFVYQYQFDFNDTDNVVVNVAIGKSFVAKILKPGTYSFDSMKSFGANKGRTRATSKGISVHDLENKYAFEIKAGEITFFPFGVGAVIKKAGSRSYTQAPNYFELTDEVLQEYGVLLGKAENAAMWELPQ